MSEPGGRDEATGIAEACVRQTAELRGEVQELLNSIASDLDVQATFDEATSIVRSSLLGHLVDAGDRDFAFSRLRDQQDRVDWQILGEFFFMEVVAQGRILAAGEQA